jgi:Transcription factor S-II (TFIIS)
MAENEELKAACPKCGERLIYVTAVPHPRAAEMLKTTFVCYPCNRTWSYPLTAAMAEAYAASHGVDPDAAQAGGALAP